jgi:hypothetical protein
MKPGKLIFALIVLCFIVQYCNRDSTKLVVKILEHPEGGTNITELTCIFSGRLADGTTPITATAEWWWMHETGRTTYVCQRGEYEFTDEVGKICTTKHTAPHGYVFNDYFWLKILWTDADGTDNELESNKARCMQGTSSKWGQYLYEIVY